MAKAKPVPKSIQPPKKFNDHSRVHKNQHHVSPKTPPENLKLVFDELNNWNESALGLKTASESVASDSEPPPATITTGAAPKKGAPKDTASKAVPPKGSARIGAAPKKSTSKTVPPKASPAAVTIAEPDAFADQMTSTQAHKLESIFQKPGVIIDLFGHEPDFQATYLHGNKTLDNKGEPLGKPTQSMTKNCGWVFSKRRKFVIIHISNFDMVTLPIYTHEERGLNGKSMTQRKDFIGIRDSEEKDKTATQSPHGNIVATRAAAWRGVLNTSYLYMKNVSYVRFTKPFTVDREAHVRIMGYIKDPAHLKKLEDLYKKCPECPQVKEETTPLW